MIKNVFIKRQNETIHEWIMFLCICLLIIGLATSRSLVSISQMLLFVNWLWEGNHIEKLKRFWRNKPVVFISSVFLVYLIGMLWTHDLAHGFDTVLKNKLPYIVLPLVLGSSRPMKSERILFVPVLFCVAILFSTIVGFTIFLSDPYIAPRDISPFYTHVSFSMMIVMAVFLFPWAVKKNTNKKAWFNTSILVSAWLLFFLFLMSSLTGIVSLAGVCLFLLFRDIVRKPGVIKIIGVSVLIIGSVAMISAIIFNIAEPLYSQKDPGPCTLDEYTAEGNPYYHNFDNDLRENGNLVFYFIAEEELRKAWNKRSNIDFDSLDNTGQKIKHTIYRYLTSKGLRKDKESLNLLDDDEIEAIENGTVNYLYLKWPNLFVRIHQTLWEIQQYERTGDPKEHSFTTRLEVWKASIAAFKKHPFSGWGTGDNLLAINTGLDLINSKKDELNMRHPHNQFVHLLVMLGVPGLVVVFGLYILFIKYSKAYRFLPYNLLLVMIFIFMLVDCPLDSQMTLNFFLFFSLYFGIVFNPCNTIKANEI